MPPEVFNETETDYKPANLLVPLDFSSQSEKALAYAKTFCERFGSVIHLLHVAEPVPMFAGIDVAPVPVDDPKKLSDLERKLDTLASRLLDGAVGRTIVRTGWATDETIAVAKELRIDLIIISTHGRSGIQRVFFGSTAEGVVRRAPCAVMVFRPGERELVTSAKSVPVDAPTVVRTILVPVDFSDASREALRCGVTFARRFQGKLICLHVLDIRPYFEPEMALGTEMELIKKSVLEATERTLQAFSKGQTTQLPRENIVTYGSTSREIIQTAEDRQVHLIVIGTHGKKGPSRFLLGSTAERVVRHAHCAVLVVPNNKQQPSAQPQ